MLGGKTCTGYKGRGWSSSWLKNIGVEKLGLNSPLEVGGG